MRKEFKVALDTKFINPKGLAAKVSKVREDRKVRQAALAMISDEMMQGLLAAAAAKQFAEDEANKARRAAAEAEIKAMAEKAAAKKAEAEEEAPVAETA